ncbi:MAG: DNA polymerase III subunit gamma/tau [FCB group bacterium]|nr:DNA polymerase III subunit gamma/tau [FCB group bacterium]
MSYQVLSRKYRPMVFEGITGQQHVTRTLQNAIRLNRVAHGYLFTGPRGIGKTTAARILAKSLNCQNYKDDNPCGICVNCVEITEGRSIDVLEIDGASNRGIDEIRDLREAVKYHPATGKYRIYIIDEVHMLTHQAFNALLKTLEEPPPHVIFIMATTDPQKIPLTILSRTQRFDFKRLTTEDIVTYLGSILTREGLSYDGNTLELIAAKADGSMRDSLSLLDQVIAYCENNIEESIVKDVLGIIEDSLYHELLTAICNSNYNALLIKISEIVDSGYSIPNFITGFNAFLRKCLFVLTDQTDKVRLNKTVITWLLENDQIVSRLDLLRMIDIILKFESRLRYIQQPRVALEALLLKLAAMDSSVLISELLANQGKSVKQQPVRKNKSAAGTSQNTPTADAPPSIAKPLHVEKQKADHISEPEPEPLNRPKETSDPLNLEFISAKWPAVLEKIELINYKIAHFLQGSELLHFTGGQLDIQLNNENGFTVRSLEKDKSAIEEIFREVTGTSVRIKFRSNPLQTNQGAAKPVEPERDHPLLLDVIEKFNGEIIR